MDADVAIVGAGAVGSATALALARRGVKVALLEAEDEPGRGASGTNSGILHAGFDSPPGQLETELILRAAELRGPVLEALAVPRVDCGALLRPLKPEDEAAISGLAENARRNGVEASRRDDGALEVPGESIVDPLALTQALAAAAVRHGAELLAPFRVSGVEAEPGALRLSDGSGDEVRCRYAVNAAGLGADAVAAAAGDDRLEIYPRKGEFLVFEQDPGEKLHRILLPVPEEGTKGVLVFPTVDGHVIAGPTAVDGTDKSDWSVRPEAREEILAKAERMHPPLVGAEPVAAYAGLRTAGRSPRDGRQVNYLIGPAPTCERLVNVAAIRSTGMTASVAIAERAVEELGSLGLELGDEAPLAPATEPSRGEPWWRRAAARSGGS